MKSSHGLSLLCLKSLYDIIFIRLLLVLRGVYLHKGTQTTACSQGHLPITPTKCKMRPLTKIEDWYRFWFFVNHKIYWTLNMRCFYNLLSEISFWWEYVSNITGEKTWFLENDEKLLGIYIYNASFWSLCKSMWWEIQRIINAKSCKSIIDTSIVTQ